MRDTGLATNYRHGNTVQEYSGVGTATNKINYAVPAGQNFFVELYYASISEGDKYIIELQVDGVGVGSIGGGEGKEGGESVPLPQYNPLGPFAPGSTIRLSRQEGTSGKDWSGGFVGYLEEI